MADNYQLRAIAALLTTVPEPALPPQVPLVVAALHASPLLENAFNSAASKNDEASGLLTRYKARVSALLHARTQQARWCGAALAKASIETSDECLAAYAKTWVPLLVTLLSRPEPRATHSLALAACSRIFNVMTLDRPALAREVTSPNIKPFLEGLVTLTSTEDPELLVSCLRALAQTLAAHPTTFRPFQKKVHALVVGILAQPPASVSPVTEELAREIYVNLHLCSTARGGNDGNGEQRSNTAQSVALSWSSLLRATISETHLALDTHFAPIVESPPPPAPAEITPILSSETPAISRATLLLRLLTMFFTLPTSAAVTVHLSPLLALTNRILAVLPPPHSTANPAHSRPERDALFTSLPTLYTSTIHLLTTIFHRLGPLALPITIPVLQHISTIFPYISPHASNTPLRRELYTLATTLLALAGPGIPKTVIRALSKTILTSAANDILLPFFSTASAANPETSSTIGNQSTATDATMGTHISSNQSLNRQALAGSAKRAKLSSKKAQAQGNNIPRNAATLADSFTNVTSSSAAASASNSNSNQNTTHIAAPAVHEWIKDLIVAALTCVPSSYIPSETRTLIDRTVVLANMREAMLASVLYPAGYARASILPHLVGCGGGAMPRGPVELGIQGVVWPRLPVVRVGGFEEEEEEGEEEDEEEVVERERRGGPANGARRERDAGVVVVESDTQKQERWRETFSGAVNESSSIFPPTIKHTTTQESSESEATTPAPTPTPHPSTPLRQQQTLLNPLTPSLQLFQQQRLHLQDLQQQQRSNLGDIPGSEPASPSPSSLVQTTQRRVTLLQEGAARRTVVEEVEVQQQQVVRERVVTVASTSTGKSVEVEDEDDDDDGEGDLVMPDIDMGEDTESDTESDGEE